MPYSFDQVGLPVLAILGGVVAIYALMRKVLRLAEKPPHPGYLWLWESACVLTYAALGLAITASMFAITGSSLALRSFTGLDGGVLMAIAAALIVLSFSVPLIEARSELKRRQTNDDRRPGRSAHNADDYTPAERSYVNS